MVNDPEILAFGRNNVTPIRALIEKPDIQTMARQLLDDLSAAIERGVLPNVDPGYLMATLSGVVFEISVAMVSRDPIDTEGAIDFATRLMMGGIANLPKKSS